MNVAVPASDQSSGEGAGNMDQLHADTTRVSEWTKATIGGVRCPECSTDNRLHLGRPYLDFSERGAVCCSACGHTWQVRQPVSQAG
jgi:Zn ribbon nucleic-acid-binding protein